MMVEIFVSDLKKLNISALLRGFSGLTDSEEVIPLGWIMHHQ